MTDRLILPDEQGFPVLLANVPNAGVSRVDPNATSGNPRHDVHSGKFGSGRRNKRPTSAPAGVDPIEWRRRIDAVRDAARSLGETFDVDDVREFLAGRTNRALDEAELNDFLSDIQAARMNDILDILDAQLRGKIEGVRRTRRKVRVTASKDYLNSAVRALTDDQLLELHNRLVAKGYPLQRVTNHLISKIGKGERREQLRSRLPADAVGSRA
jgi:hypothetical protein